MIDLNRYYISSTFIGASGGSDGRSGYVPRALSADELKFLRGDGTWQEVQTDLSGYLSLSGGTLTGQLNVFNSISSTQTVFASAIALSAVTFTGETKTSTTSVTATDTYVKVIVEGQIKYLRLFDVI